MAEQTPEGFVFDVKVHRCPRDTPRCSTRCCPTCVTRPRPISAAVRLTPELELTAARRLVEETALFAEVRPGSYLVQLTPGFSPRRRLEELDGLVEALAPYRAAIELRNRDWVREERRDGTLGWFADRDVAYVPTPPGDNFQIMPPTSTRSPAPDLAYLRLHGRNTDGYLSGKSVAERFGLARGGRARGAGTPRRGNGRAGRRGARGLQQQPR